MAENHIESNNTTPDKSEVKKFKKRAGVATTEGQRLEYDTIAVLYHRALRASDDFLIGSNLEDFGAFDDIVFKINSKVYCIQMKHKGGGGKWKQETLLQTKGDYSLHKYYKSYCHIKTVLQNPEHNADLINGTKLQDYVFALHTNMQVPHKATNIDESEMSLGEKMLFARSPKQTSELFSFDESDEKILNMIENEPEFHEFLGQLRIFSGQIDVSELPKVIKEEVKETIGDDTSEEVHLKFSKSIEKWWNESKCFLCPQSPEWLIPLMTHLNTKMSNELKNLEYKFNKQTCDDLKQRIAEAKIVNVVVPDVQSKLRCSKFHSMLCEYYEDKFLLMDAADVTHSLKHVLSICRGKFFEILVVNIDRQAQMDRLLSDLKQIPCKLIFVSEKRLKHKSIQLQEQDVWECDHLRDDSKNKMFRTEVDFQGFAVNLQDMFHRGLSTRLSGKVWSELLKGKKVYFGCELTKPSNYIDRIVVHSTVLKEAVLWITHNEDIFAVSGFRQGWGEPLDSTIVLSYHDNISKHPTSCHPDEVKYKDICEKSKKNVHWLIYEDGILLWKESRGSKQTPAQYVDRMGSHCEDKPLCDHRAECLQDWKERLLLITGEPGMGKTTLLQKVGYETKDRNRASWIIHIVLSAFTTSLQSITGDNIKLDEVLDKFILTEDYVTKSTCSALSRELLRDSVKNVGNVTIFLDAVDEVSSLYNNQVLMIVQVLLKTKVATLWVTSRTSLQEFLKTKLSALPLELRPFSKMEWNEFFSQYYPDNFEHITEALEQMVHMNRRGRHICDVPLHAKMVAEAIMALENDEMLAQLNLYRMYKIFFERKFEKYFCDKCGYIPSHPKHAATIKRETEISVIMHMKYALLVVFSPEERAKLNVPTDESEDKEEREIDENGIIVGIVDGIPKFVHFTFSEYFAALWCKEQCYKNMAGNVTCQLEVLLNDKFELPHLFLDQMLSEGSDLHEAVLSGSVEYLKERLEHLESVDAQDNVGRLALHLAVAHRFTEATKLLLERGSSVDIEDRVFGWSPLHYADKIEDWDLAEMLLEFGAEPSHMLTLKRQVDEQGLPTLLSNASEGRLKITDAILQMGIEVNERNTVGVTALRCAALNGKTLVVKLLLDKGADINCADINGSTPLHGAATWGRYETVQLLLERGSDVNMRDKEGNTPLNTAASEGYTDIVKLLLEKEADVNQKNERGYTPLLDATRKEREETVSLLLERNVNVHDTDKEGNTAIKLAVLHDYTDIVKMLLHKGADINHTDSLGDTLLHIAVSKGRDETLKVLLDNEAVVDAENKNKNTALRVAAGQGSTEKIKLLLDKGANVNCVNIYKDTPLHGAIWKGMLEPVKVLLEHEADVHLADSNGDSALNVAAVNGHHDVVQLLLTKGSDVHSCNGCGDSPLVAATRRNDVETVEVLLRHGADQKFKDKQGNTALNVAAWKTCTTLVRLFVEQGADVTLSNSVGDTPLHGAAWCGQTDLVEFLIEKGADVNAFNKLGYNPLYFAVKRGHIETTKSLLNHNSNVTFHDKQNTTALHIAAEKGHGELLELLLDKVANVDLSILHSAVSSGVPEIVIQVLKFAPEIDIRAWRNSALTKAASQGKVDVILALLENEVDINSVDDEGRTPLMNASENGHLDAVRELVKHNTNVHAKDKNCNTALNLAAKGDHIEIILELKNNMADINSLNGTGYAALHTAVYSGKSKFVKTLLDHGAEVDVLDRFGITPLWMAAKSGHKSVVNLLLDNFANVDCANTKNKTALHVAMEQGHLDITDILLKRGVDVNLSNEDGNIALNIAVNYNKPEFIRKLHEHKVDINCKNQKGFTLLHYAAWKDKLESAETLLDLGVDVNVENNYGQTALWTAARWGHTRMLNLLLDKGANVYYTNNSRQNPLDVAKREGHTDIVQILEARRVNMYRNQNVFRRHHNPPARRGRPNDSF